MDSTGAVFSGSWFFYPTVNASPSLLSLRNGTGAPCRPGVVVGAGEGVSAMGSDVASLNGIGADSPGLSLLSGCVGLLLFSFTAASAGFCSAFSFCVGVGSSIFTGTGLDKGFAE